MADIHKHLQRAVQHRTIATIGGSVPANSPNDHLNLPSILQVAVYIIGTHGAKMKSTRKDAMHARIKLGLESIASMIASRAALPLLLPYLENAGATSKKRDAQTRARTFNPRNLCGQISFQRRMEVGRPLPAAHWLAQSAVVPSATTCV